MRKLFFETLAALGESDPRVLLLTADLGFRAIEPFALRCPKQFYNVGVCEQNMVGLATGLAEAGFLPFVYSIAPFAVLRPYEFIRNGPVAHRLPVRILSVGGGFEYGSNGLSHYGLEDLGVLRLQPRLGLITPADKLQAKTALERLWNTDAPLYFRLSKNEESVVPGLSGRFSFGLTQTICSGTDIVLIALGPAVFEALEAARFLKEQQISAQVELVDNLNGPTLLALPGLLSRFPAVVTVEMHYVNGGLGSMIGEMIAENGIGARLIRCGVKSVPDGVSGSESFLLKRYGLDAASIATAAVQALGREH